MISRITIYDLKRLQVAKELPRLWDREWRPFRDFLEEKLSQEHPWSLEQIWYAYYHLFENVKRHKHRIFVFWAHGLA